MRNYFQGKTIEWLLAMRNRVQDEIASHSAMTGFGGADAHNSRQQLRSMELTLDRIEYSLSELDPVKYPYKASDGDSVVGIQFS